MASAAEEPVQKHSLHTLIFRSLKRSHDMFLSDRTDLPQPDEASEKLKVSVKAHSEYGAVIEAAKAAKRAKEMAKLSLPEPPQPVAIDPTTGTVSLPPQKNPLMLTAGPGSEGTSNQGSTDLALLAQGRGPAHDNVKAMLPRKAPTMPKPSWHPPWKLYRVISGHAGWVRCVDVEPGNEWFVTGSGDRIIKIWDLASGKLKLSLTGHISTVRGVKVSHRQPYLYSVGEDKTVKCWDLEHNKVIRHYHGHLSAVYDLDIHPTIDVLVTCGRDSTAREQEGKITKLASSMLIRTAP